MKILVIIPAYNEEDNIVTVVENIKATMPDGDCIVVNDGSTDHTLDICRQKGIAVLNLPINLGIGGAVQLGYIYANRNGYDVAVQVDGDGQHDPRYLKHLIAQIARGDADLVIGSRFIEKQGFQSTFLRRLGIKFFHKLLRLCCGTNIIDTTSGFRACNKAVIDYFATHYPEDYPEPESIMTLKREGFRISEVPVVMAPRRGGISSINSLQPLYYMLKVTLAILIDRLKPRKRNLQQGKV